MMMQILVPVDFKPQSLIAMETAGKIQSQFIVF
jgi:hypothetical protein